MTGAERQARYHRKRQRERAFGAVRDSKPFTLDYLAEMAVTAEDLARWSPENNEDEQ